MFKHPFYDWKNLTFNPNVGIRGNVVKIADILPDLKATVETLRSHGKNLQKTISNIADLDIKIKKKEAELKKTKIDKKRTKLDKELKSLLRKKESITKKHKGVEADFVKKAADSYVKFEGLIKIIHTLNLQCLTLIHRARKDINDMISKIKVLRHERVAELEQLKSISINELNSQKKHLKDLCEVLYRSSEFQQRGKFNPAELTHEMSWQGTRLKCRRVRQLTIEIDNIEGRMENISKKLSLPQVPHFARAELKSQIDDFEYLSHHIKILTHRFHQILDKYPENKKLKNEFRNKLRNIVRQTRLLWNSIRIEHYRPKAKLLKFRKKEELKVEQIRKAA
ncbi:hypothetical protein KY345_01145 [Candidatus Woesearchaeota archaeon]|nr:hypothetical protein [Candidatus Woesearchaeota archaeon]